jgi:hypothetical protein
MIIGNIIIDKATLPERAENPFNGLTSQIYATIQMTIDGVPCKTFTSTRILLVNLFSSSAKYIPTNIPTGMAITEDIINSSMVPKREFKIPPPPSPGDGGREVKNSRFMAFIPFSII